MEEIKQSGGGRQEGRPPETAVRERGCRAREQREERERRRGQQRGRGSEAAVRRTSWVGDRKPFRAHIRPIIRSSYFMEEALQH